jgi:prepilin-type N-terminal cleavage/methylation domain-containing protein
MKPNGKLQTFRRWSLEIRHARGAFTLIEVMVVVGIMCIVMAMSVPFVYRSLRREPLNQAVRDVEEVCSNARARAIMQGVMTEVVFHPKERRFEVAGGSAPSTSEPTVARPDASAVPPTGSGLAAQISDRVVLRGLFINLIEYTDNEEARVRFYPNGTSDEMLVILNGDRNEQRGISLEVTTGFASVLNEDDLQKLRK